MHFYRFEKLNAPQSLLEQLAGLSLTDIDASPEDQLEFSVLVEVRSCEEEKEILAV